MGTRLFAPFLLVSLLAVPDGVMVQSGQKGTLLVVNRTGGSISLFDLNTSVEMARVPIGPVIPHEVAVSPDGRLAMTGEYGPNDNPGRHLVVIDVAEGRQAGRIDLGPQSRPHSIMFMKDGRRAVATLELSDRVALVDVVARKVIRTYPTGGREGHMVRLSPDGTRAYVTSRGAAGTLSVIALEGDQAPVVIPTGEGAEGLAVSPDGSEVWVVNRLAGTISIVDTRSLEVTATLDVPPDARRAEISVGGASSCRTAARLTPRPSSSRCTTCAVGRWSAGTPCTKGERDLEASASTSSASGPSRATGPAAHSWHLTWQTSLRLVQSRPTSTIPMAWRTRPCACRCWSDRSQRERCPTIGPC